MMLEHALLPVREGEEENFIASLKLALPIINSAPGCHGAEVRRQDEDPSVFLLLVRWESVAVHMQFRDTELYARWRELTHPFYALPLSVTHFHDPIEN